MTSQMELVPAFLSGRKAILTNVKIWTTLNNFLFIFFIYCRKRMKGVFKNGDNL